MILPTPNAATIGGVAILFLGFPGAVMKRLLFCLLCMSVVGCGESEQGGQKSSSENQQDAIAALEKLGARILYKDDKVLFVGLGGAQITDADLVHLKRVDNYFPFLQLDLSGTKTTDAGLVHLKDIKEVSELLLDGTQVTNEGLLHLQGLPKLSSLGLTNTSITDAGVEHLQQMTNLGSVFLGGTKITDTGIVHMKKLKNLNLLLLHGAQISDAAVADLQKALPDCEIHR